MDSPKLQSFNSKRGQQLPPSLYCACPDHSYAPQGIRADPGTPQDPTVGNRVGSYQLPVPGRNYPATPPAQVMTFYDSSGLTVCGRGVSPVGLITLIN